MLRLFYLTCCTPTKAIKRIWITFHPEKLTDYQLHTKVSTVYEIQIITVLDPLDAALSQSNLIQTLTLA